MTRCAQRHGSSAFARTSLVVFALAVCAAEISAAMPARLLRSSAPDRAFNSAGARAENAAAQITFRKVFKTSYPEFVEIKINQAGTGTYDIRQLDEDANPQPFEVSAPLAQRIFALAAKLNNFQNVDLDVHRRLANLGAKSLVYEKGGEKHETDFNYTLDDTASQLVNIFEGLARQTTDLSDLVRTMRYDHLGVNDVMQQIERDYNSKLLPEPERLLPTLDQLAADEKFIDLARTRARSLAARIRSSH
ncbi:MAG TPA: hypothetical protein VN902_20210 [Candidatus Acidoferrales bacterium]|nr:hypothetical protein [Candidatus Acidoferrales bacterium]